MVLIKSQIYYGLTNSFASNTLPQFKAFQIFLRIGFKITLEWFLNLEVIWVAFITLNIIEEQLYDLLQKSHKIIQNKIQALLYYMNLNRNDLFNNQNQIFSMDKDSNPIDLAKLKQLIHTGIQAIPIDNTSKEAVIVIGDTGVGKSTIMSFLSGSKLVVKYDGLKPTLDNEGQSKIKIGHQKYSQTSIPTKVVIQQMAFYDCPGFKDNKGEQYEISNSFFVQRLLNIYQKVKIVLIIDESHISEARADKLPKLIRNLRKAFRTFQDIKDGVLLIINRVAKDNSVQDYQKQIKKMVVLKNQNGYLFQEQERNFMNFLIEKNKVLIFKQAHKQQKNQQFKASSNQRSILQAIKQCRLVKGKHIQNILSESAKLSIRDFIDQITTKSNYKIQLICAFIVQSYSQKVQALGRDVNGILLLKQQIIRLAQEMKATKKQQVINILQRELPSEKLQDFEEDFASVIFFKGIYDKTSTYFSNLINKIYSQLSHLLTKLDKRITLIQRQNHQQIQRQKQQKQQKVRIEKRQQEKIIAMQHCSKMDDLKVIGQTLVSTKRSLIEQIKSAMRSLSSVQEQLKNVKRDAVNLKKMSRQIDGQFQRIEVTYFQKKSVRS